MRKVVHVGAKPTDGGHAIEIELRFDDGTSETVKCDYGFVPAVLSQIHRAGGEAELHQAGAVAQNETVVSRYRATDCRTGRGADGSIAIQFATEAGYPVTLSMPESLAQQTIGLLEAELRKAPPPRSRTN